MIGNKISDVLLWFILTFPWPPISGRWKVARWLSIVRRTWKRQENTSRYFSPGNWSQNPQRFSRVHSSFNG